MRRLSLHQALPGIALVLAALSIFLSVVLFAKIQSEGRERRSQSCLSSEGKHLDEVNQLKRTYGYLERNREHLNVGLAAEIMRVLPETERHAMHDAAPAFCDEPGIGLPEPDPKIPKRPAFLPPE